MRRAMLLFSCVFVMLCLVPAFSHAADGADGKAQISSTEMGKKEKEKETSLYLYYQKYLNPYFGKGRAKPVEKAKTTEPKGTLASNPSSTADPQRPKAVDSPLVSGDARTEAKSDPSAERPYLVFNKLDSVGIDAINRTFPQIYRKEYLAELGLGFKLSPEVDVSVGKVQKFERTGDNPWGAHDDGWRIRLQKNF